MAVQVFTGNGEDGSVMLRKLLTWILALWMNAAMVGECAAAFHTWQISEIYSNADGTVQFIELSNISNGENFVHGQVMTATGTATKTFTIPTDLNPTLPSANRKFLIGTQGFANLGIVTPDYIMPPGFLTVATSGSTADLHIFESTEPKAQLREPNSRLTEAMNCIQPKA